MKKAGLSYEFAGAVLWSAAAFIIAIWPLAGHFYWKLAFRKIYIPAFFLCWTAAGAFLLRFLTGQDRRQVREFIFSAVLFNMVVLFPQLLSAVNSQPTLSAVYKAYIYAAVAAVTVLCTVWAAGRFFYGQLRPSCATVPLLLAPLFCVAHAAYHANAPGAAVFAISALIAAAIILLRQNRIDLAGRVSSFLSGLIKNEAALIGLIFLTGLLMRLAFSFIVVSKTGKDYVLASDDGMTYDAIARAIAADPAGIVKILVRQPWPPVYMFFLSVLYKAFNANYYIVSSFQSVLGAGVAVLAYLTASRLFGKGVGVLAGFLVAMSQPLIFLSSVLGTESVYIPLVVLAIYLFVTGRMALSGMVFGLASMTIGSIVLFPLVALVFTIFPDSARRPLIARVRSAIRFFAPFIIVYLSIKSIYVFADSSLKSSYETEGMALWSAGSAYGYAQDPDNREFIALGLDPFNKPLASIRIAALRWKEVADIGSRIFPIRLRNFFLWNNFGSFDPIFLANSARVPNPFGPTLEFYTIIAFLVGLYFAFAACRKDARIVFILLFICYYVFIHAIMIVSRTNRYSSPVKPYLIIFLAVGLSNVFRYFLSSRKD